RTYRARQHALIEGMRFGEARSAFRRRRPDLASKPFGQAHRVVPAAALINCAADYQNRGCCRRKRFDDPSQEERIGPQPSANRPNFRNEWTWLVDVIHWNRQKKRPGGGVRRK